MVKWRSPKPALGVRAPLLLDFFILREYSTLFPLREDFTRTPKENFLLMK